MVGKKEPLKSKEINVAGYDDMTIEKAVYITESWEKDNTLFSFEKYQKAMAFIEKYNALYGGK